LAILVKRVAEFFRQSLLIVIKLYLGGAFDDIKKARGVSCRGWGRGTRQCWEIVGLHVELRSRPWRLWTWLRCCDILRARDNPTRSASRIVATLMVDHIPSWRPTRRCPSSVCSARGIIIPTRHFVSTTSTGTTSSATASLANILLGLDRVRQVAGLVVVVRLVLAHASWEIILGQARAWLVVWMHS